MLLATDRSKASLAHLSYAARLGNALGARLTLFHALRPTQLIVNPAFDDRTTPTGESPEEARTALTEIANTLGSNRPVHVEVDNTLQDHDAILAAADRVKADMVVLPTHGRTGLSRAVLGSVAEQVMRRAQHPVLLLTDHMLENEQKPAKEHGPVMLATDLSDASKVAHRPAADLAKRLGLRLRMLSVLSDVAPPPHGGGAPVAPAPNAAAVRIEGRTRDLRDAAGELSATVEAEIDVRIAHDIAAEIVSAASGCDAAMLVLTTHGRRGIARMVKGSVAEQVVRHATMPVMVMPKP